MFRWAGCFRSVPSRRAAPLSAAIRRGLRESWKNRVYPLHGGRASSVPVDASAPGWRRPSGETHVPRVDAGRARYWRSMVRSARAYRSHLASCDSGRRNDLDGRGTLSEETLAVFTEFFLTVCIDQVSFMESLVQPDRLRARILGWAEEEVRIGALQPKAGKILEAVLYRSALPRGETEAIVGTGERQARRVVASLVEAGVLSSDGPRGPLQLVFPAGLAGRWMPGLFPEQVS
jgi:hypothetical protein